jgi:hypothetical protein
MSERMIPVFQAQGEVEAQQVRAFLRAHGIPAVLHGEALRKTHGMVLDGLGAVTLLVPSGEAHRAGALLDQARRGELQLEEDLELGGLEQDLVDRV